MALVFAQAVPAALSEPEVPKPILEQAKGEVMIASECRCCEMNAADRPSWGDGPWANEPDRAEWEHNGLPCITHRGGNGAWCGYVGVPPTHPLHGKRYGEVDLEVHGGLTYSDACHGHICHTPKPGEGDDVWWFGFDCAHAFDLCPTIDAKMRDYIFHGIPEGHYWTLEEVRAEVNQLADQLAALMVK